MTFGDLFWPIRIAAEMMLILDFTSEEILL